MPRYVFFFRYVLLAVSLLMVLFFGCQSPEDVFDRGTKSDEVAPTVPGGLAASEITDSTIVLSWQPAGDNVAVKTYILYQDTIEIVEDSLTQYTVTDLLPQTEYTYAVRSVDGAGNKSNLSPHVAVTTLEQMVKADSVQVDTIAPIAPKNLTALNTSRTTTDLSWEAAADSIDVKVYRVYQDTTLIATLPETEYQVTDLIPETAYTFSVSALDAVENESVSSNVVTVTTMMNDSVERDTIPPAAPSNLVVLDTAQTSVDLKWDAATDSVEVVAYRVYQDTMLIANVTETIYQVMALTADTDYIFSVSALDASENESEASEAVTITTKMEETVEQDTVPPTVPVNVMANEVTTTTASLSWDAATDDSGIAGYTVFQDGDSIANVVAATYEVMGLTSETSYSFNVSAIDMSENESDLSEAVTITTKMEETVEQDTVPPTVPVNVMANEVTETTVNLSWDAATDDSGIANYTIFQDGDSIATTTEIAYQVMGLSADTSYSFAVSATDTKENESELSETISVTTEEAPDTVAPTIPANVTANDITETTASLSWDTSTDDSGVANYTIFQEGNALASVTKTNYEVTGLSAGTSYSFTISATDIADNESEPSATVSVLTEEARSMMEKVLVFTKTEGFRHTSIQKGVATLTALGAANNFEVVQSENSGNFNTQNLEQYQLVVFLNTTGDVLNGTQQTAFENYIRSGGSFMGVHAATDTEYDWAWYGQLVGAYFNGHPEIQQATVDVINANHPSTSHLSGTWVRTDEWYNFRNIDSGINVLLQLDESSYSGGTNGDNHPIAWYREFDGGRTFYTGGGHGNAAYDEPDFREHLLGGILYCLDRAP